MNLIRAVVLILALVVVSSCQKEELIDPVGLYNVSTQVGSQPTKLGVMTINKHEGAYLIWFDMASGGFGEIKCNITAGNIDIPSYSYKNVVYQGSGKVSEDGVVNLGFKLINHGASYQVKVQGNRAK